MDGAAEIRSRIESGTWPRLPSIEHLAREHGVSRYRVSEALRELRTDGLVAKDGNGRWLQVRPGWSPARQVDRVTAQIRERVEAGDWAVLPDHRTLPRLVGAGHGTVLRALRRLADEGIVAKAALPGRGPGWVAAGGRKVLGTRAEAVAAEIRRRIESGEWAELPRLADIAAEFGAGTNQVRAAVERLAGDGLLARAPNARKHKWVVARNVVDGRVAPGSDLALGRLGRWAAAEIERRIESGEWAELPAYTEICRILGVSYGPVLPALRYLRARGVVALSKARQGPKRWVVARPDLPSGYGFAAVLADRVADRIRRERWIRLPSMTELIRMFSTSHQTMTSALHALAGRGLVIRDTPDGRRGRWILAPEWAEALSNDVVPCLRARCVEPSLGRGLCVRHYARWFSGADPLTLPDDTAPAPRRTVWTPPG